MIKKNKKSKILFASALLGIASIATVPILLTSCGNSSSSSTNQSIDEDDSKNNNDDNNNNQDDNDQNNPQKTETPDIILNKWEKEGKTGTYFDVENNAIKFRVITANKDLSAEKIKQDIYMGQWIEKQSSTGLTTGWYVVNSYKDVAGFKNFINYGLDESQGGKTILDTGMNPLNEKYINFDAIESDLIKGSATIEWTPSQNALKVQIRFSLEDFITYESKETYDIEFNLEIV
ncbi:MAG: hypothetical protein K2H56_03850 [Malacoplasma sp.]|nr:hypothetical protein [Malacoplasma sp.]MDE7099886.1 hypothetical protein [Malacoplasma sp.]